MKRLFNRALRNRAEMAPVAENNSAYIGKHEKLTDSMAEILMAEISEIVNTMAEALEVTEEFMAEICGYVSAKLARYDVRKIAPMKIMERICVDGKWFWFDTDGAEKVRNLARRGLVRIREVIPYAGIV